MKLSQYLRIKIARDLDYNPDEAHALLEQANYSEPTLAQKLEETGRMLQNPAAYFADKNNKQPAEEPIDDNSIDMYDRGVIDAQNAAANEADEAKLKSLGYDLKAINDTSLMQRIAGTALGATGGAIGSMMSAPELGPTDHVLHPRALSSIPLGMIGATNAYHLSRALGAGKKGRMLAALAGGILHPAANILANSGTGFGEPAKYPLLSRIMQIYNPIAGGIAGYLQSGFANNMSYNNVLDAYNRQAQQNAYNKANRKILKPEYFKK